MHYARVLMGDLDITLYLTYLYWHRSISFIDLAGHEKYLKTTLHGLVGRAPQFCILTISAVPCERY